MRDKTYLIMAGGTGGHVYPALATAHALMHRNERVVWLGSRNGMEEGIVSAAGIPFYGLAISGLRGKGWGSLLLAPLRLTSAVFAAMRVIKKTQPDCVLGMGGFASGPGGLAAKLMGKPLVIHEQNAVAGMTNRWLAKFANRVLEAFPDSFPAHVETRLTGNPLRSEVCELYYRQRKPRSAQERLRVLVLGGSLGAAHLNQVVPEALQKLDREEQPEVWHQTGKNKCDETRERYSATQYPAKVEPYIENMAEAYAWADFVVCRAGALTISELCVAGLGAILVPYPYAVDDHQTLNARAMEAAGAAWLLPQDKLDADTLVEILRPLINKRERIERLSMAAHQLGRPDATELVVQECRSVCYG
ncbi:MAG: undecaprenyldiphospho-muramoylpentapeptide beta-N-acetylglucosaminyltransferase [Oleiphilaceae bacterium]|nr:undecaprenyldiphospho-muramoylpentapeptide beta-N-acetylglucosaminyltransferase [Oleiphilaceae bacterium]